MKVSWPEFAVLRAVLAVAAGAVLSNCSNAPPNAYQFPRALKSEKISWSLTPRLTLPFEGNTYKYYSPDEAWERSDGTPSYPQYANIVDFLTISGAKKIGPFSLGLYSSNLYPGVFAGVDSRYLSINGFSSMAVFSGTILPGLQVHSEFKHAYFSYSLYRQHLGSLVLNPAWGEPGPTEDVLAERFNIGFRPYRKNRDIGIGFFLDRAYWKGVFVTGIEWIVNI